MDYVQDIYYSDIFDFGDFIETGSLFDCEIRAREKEGSDEFVLIKAHKIILSNSSVFFNNIFTSGMEESHTGIVDVSLKSSKLLPSVIRWMYTGKIDFTYDDLMPLLNVSHNYGVTELEKQLIEILNTVNDEKVLIGLTKKCYDEQLDKELQLLIPILAKNFNKIPLNILSEELDVVTFSNIIKLTELSTEEKVKSITEFLKDWDPSDEEKRSLGDAFQFDEARALHALSSKYNITWLPAK